jgi:hypothetical protein
MAQMLRDARRSRPIIGRIGLALLALHLLTHEVPIVLAAAWGAGRLLGWW